MGTSKTPSKTLKSIQEEIIDIFNREQVHPYVAYVLLDCLKKNIIDNMILESPKGKLPTLKEDAKRGYQ